MIWHCPPQRSLHRGLHPRPCLPRTPSGFPTACRVGVLLLPSGERLDLRLAGPVFGWNDGFGCLKARGAARVVTNDDSIHGPAPPAHCSGDTGLSGLRGAVDPDAAGSGATNGGGAGSGDTLAVALAASRSASMASGASAGMALPGGYPAVAAPMAGQGCERHTAAVLPGIGTPPPAHSGGPPGGRVWTCPEGRGGGCARPSVP